MLVSDRTPTLSSVSGVCAGLAVIQAVVRYRSWGSRSTLLIPPSCNCIAPEFYDLVNTAASSPLALGQQRPDEHHNPQPNALSQPAPGSGTCADNQRQEMQRAPGAFRLASRRRRCWAAQPAAAGEPAAAAAA